MITTFQKYRRLLEIKKEISILKNLEKQLLKITNKMVNNGSNNLNLKS